MNKMLFKIATCGVLALSIQAVSAQQMQLAKDAAAKVANSETAKAFVSKITNGKLVVTKATTNAEMTAALNSLSAADQLAAIQLINKYANKASVNAAAKGVNDSIANTVLRDKSGALVQLASAQALDATRSGTKSAGECSKLVDASKLAAGTKVSFADVQAAIQAGNIIRGTCTEIMEDMSENARENIDETGVCMTNKNAQSVKGQARVEIANGCFLGALNNDGGATVSPEVAAQKLAQVTQKCNFFNLRAAN
jgi:hypothetical protein